MRQQLAVNATVNRRNPIALLAGLVAQQAACRDPAIASRLQEAGMNPHKCLERIDPLVRDLDRAIAEGMLGVPRKRDVQDEVLAALVKVEIVLARAEPYLEDYVSASAARAFEKAIPRRRAGAAVEEAAAGGAPGEGGAPPAGGAPEEAKGPTPPVDPQA